MKKPKKFIFTLMPFDERFNDIYTFGIKQTCSEKDAYCERVDEQIFSERILDRIYNQISKADLIIADMSERNPNVFYEVGYAHGLGKNVILLTQNAEDIPFDLKHFPHIIYDGKIKSLGNALKTKLDWFLRDIDMYETDFEFGLDFMINGVRITEGITVDLTEDIMHYYTSFDLKLEIYNSARKIFNSKFKVGFEVEDEHINYFQGLEKIKTSTKKTLLISEEISQLYPQSYQSIVVKVGKKEFDNSDPVNIPVSLKIFTAMELKEINFNLNLNFKKFEF